MINKSKEKVLNSSIINIKLINFYIIPSNKKKSIPETQSPWPNLYHNNIKKESIVSKLPQEISLITKVKKIVNTWASKTKIIWTTVCQIETLTSTEINKNSSNIENSATMQIHNNNLVQESSSNKSYPTYKDTSTSDPKILQKVKNILFSVGLSQSANSSQNNTNQPTNLQYPSTILLPT